MKKKILKRGRGQPRKVERNMKVVKLRKQGLTFVKIAKKLGVGLSTVSDIWYRD